MFKRRYLPAVTPTKRPARISSSTSTSSSSLSSSQKPQPISDDEDDQNLEYLQEHDGDDDEFSDYAPEFTSSRKSSLALKAVYIVSQSSNESDPEPSSTPSFECSDKVISVHTTKSSANAAAKKHLRRLCGIRSNKDAKEKEESGEGEYREGVGTKSLFVGSMKRKEGVVRVQTQWWKVKR